LGASAFAVRREDAEREILELYDKVFVLSGMRGGEKAIRTVYERAVGEFAENGGCKDGSIQTERGKDADETAATETRSIQAECGKDADATAGTKKIIDHDRIDEDVIAIFRNLLKS
jgi:hypothetical protein